MQDVLSFWSLRLASGSPRGRKFFGFFFLRVSFAEYLLCTKHYVRCLAQIPHLTSQEPHEEVLILSALYQ